LQDVRKTVTGRAKRITMLIKLYEDMNVYGIHAVFIKLKQIKGT